MNRLLVPIITILAICQTSVEAQIPKLVVMLSAEELRMDLLEEITPHLSDTGIKKLMSEGTLYHDVYNPLLHADATACEAMLYTGTTPLYNGVVGRSPIVKRKDGSYGQASSIFNDNDYTGLATSSRLSPTVLSSPTIADRLKQSTGYKGIVYAIAPNAEEAIIAGGHHANGVFWIDDYTAKWVSSSYYKTGFPAFLSRYNAESGLANTLSHKVWQPLRKDYITDYAILPYILKDETTPFKYSYGNDGGSISRFKTSGLINGEVISVAQQLIQYSDIGRDEMPDLLAIHLYMGNPSDKDSDLTPELIDNYYRTDEAISNLIKTIDTSIGLSNVAFVLVGNSMAKEYYTEHEVIGTFYPERCKALLNMLLMAKYGDESWIENVTENEVYLNHQAIKKNRIPLEEIQNYSSQFVSKFSGVSSAVSAYRLVEESLLAAEEPRLLTLLNLSTNKNRGDVVFSLYTGWLCKESKRVTKNYVMSRITSPLIISIPHQKKSTINVPKDIRTVSKRVCDILHIRPPTP